MAADEKTAVDDPSAEDDSERGETALVSESASTESPGNEPEVAPAQLGATKYVHAAFFLSGILLAFILGKLLSTAWNILAEWPAVVRAVPQLLRYAEDERPTFTTVAGALIAVAVVVHYYRKESVRAWADEVASELSKVVWPNKETVTNGTIVVLVACAVATVYVGLLDRLWGFVTTLVYGA